MKITHSPHFSRGKVMKGRRLGMTLLEMTFVLLIMVAVIGGALTMASSTMDQSTAVQETQTINSLASAARKTRMSDGYPTDIGLAMHDLGFVPSNVDHQNGNDYRNSWGGDIMFGQESDGGNFSITYTNIPVKECRQLVLSVKAGLLQSVGTTITATGAATHNIRDLTASDVTTICAGGTVVWSSALGN